MGEVNMTLFDGSPPPYALAWVCPLDLEASISKNVWPLGPHADGWVSTLKD